MITDSSRGLEHGPEPRRQDGGRLGTQRCDVTALQGVRRRFELLGAKVRIARAILREVTRPEKVFERVDVVRAVASSGSQQQQQQPAAAARSSSSQPASQPAAAAANFPGVVFL